MFSFPVFSAEDKLISYLSDVNPDENYFNSIINLSNSTNKSNPILVSEYNEICRYKKNLM